MEKIKINFNDLEEKAILKTITIGEVEVETFVIDKDSFETLFISIADLRNVLKLTDNKDNVRVHRSVSEFNGAKYGKKMFYSDDDLLEVDFLRLGVLAVKQYFYYEDLERQDAEIKDLSTQIELMTEESKRLHSNCNNLTIEKNAIQETLIEKSKALSSKNKQNEQLHISCDKLQKELEPLQNRFNNKNNIVKFILYMTLVLAGVTTARVGYVELFEIHSNTPDIVFLIAVLLGAMMSVTTFFTNHLKNWQHSGLLLFFCIVEFCSMTLYFDVFNGFEWYLTFIIAFFLPVTNLILANIINHIRSDKSIY